MTETNQTVREQWCDAAADGGEHKLGSELDCDYCQGYNQGHRAGAEAQRERWIPVSERLPELKCNAPQMVLMAIAGRELPEMGWKLIEENRWQSVETGPHDWPIYVNMDQVTHWMPLPDPPRFAPIEGEKE